MILKPFLKEIVKRALEEDVGSGDVTTNAIVPDKMKTKAIIYARENGVVAGLDMAIEVFRQLDKNVKVKKFINDGTKVRKNQSLLGISGKARALLTGERTALNFLQHLSGIATLTSKYVNMVKPSRVKIFTTRKTIPGLRFLEKYAVRMGGGYNHRMGLYEMAMVKDNHLEIQNTEHPLPPTPGGWGGALFHGGYPIQNIVKKIRKKIPKGMKIEVEVKNLREVKAVFESGVDIIMLDNMNIERMKRAVKLIQHLSLVNKHKKPIIEASGNVGLHNVGIIAKTGVDWISVGELTHSAPALDISMEIQKR